mmetsp:Transcript_31612/g.70893  ORF Transcript_31612/g.70893 Transcript_31612/m.70893 type:complete len:642 (+) Transcript_31612:563-2488(+)
MALLWMMVLLSAKNPNIVDPNLDWDRLMRTDYWGLEMFDPDKWTHKSFRPLTTLTFRWNYQSFGGMDTSSYFVTNVVLHVVCSFLVGVYCKVVCRIPALYTAAATALFASHPVHTESLMYVVGRADPLCAILVLIGVVVYDKCCNRRPDEKVHKGTWTTVKLLLGFLLTTLLFLAAGLCKETGFTFFGLLVGQEILPILTHSWRPTPPSKEDLIPRAGRILAILICGGAACGWRVWYTSGTGIERMDPYSNPFAANDNGYTRKLSYTFVHGMYGKLLVWPYFLCYDYSHDAIPLLTSLTDLRLGLGSATYTAFAAIVHLVLRALASNGTRSAGYGAAVNLGFFLLSFFPMSNIAFPVGTVVAERLLYKPSIALVGAAAVLGQVIMEGPITKSRHSRRFQAAAGVGFLGLWAFWWARAYKRCWEWETVERMFFTDGYKQLHSERTQLNLGNYHLMHGEYRDALAAYERAVASDPAQRDAVPLYHAAQIHMAVSHDMETAEKYLKKAVTGYFSPLVIAEEEVWHDYGLVLWQTKKPEESIRNLQVAVMTNPLYTKGLNNLACATTMHALTQNDHHTAMQGLQTLQRAIELSPNTPMYWRNAASLFKMVGDLERAQHAWQQVYYLEGEDPGEITNNCIWEFYFR